MIGRSFFLNVVLEKLEVFFCWGKIIFYLLSEAILMELKKTP